MNIPATLWTNVPQDQLDEQVTVVKLELDGPLSLHGGEGAEIDVN